jgi:hypothetical protein
MADKKREAKVVLRTFVQTNRGIEIKFTHMGRDKNQFANALATLSSMAKIDCGNRIQPLNIDIKNSSAYCCLGKEEMNGNPWYHDIKWFIQYQEYPREVFSTNMKTLQRLALDYYLDEEILYKRS